MANDRKPDILVDEELKKDSNFNIEIAPQPILKQLQFDFTPNASSDAQNPDTTENKVTRRPEMCVYDNFKDFMNNYILKEWKKCLRKSSKVNRDTLFRKYKTAIMQFRPKRGSLCMVRIHKGRQKGILHVTNPFRI